MGCYLRDEFFRLPKSQHILTGATLRVSSQGLSQEGDVNLSLRHRLKYLQLQELAFMVQINNDPLLFGFEFPNIPYYDGWGDLRDNIRSFILTFHSCQVANSVPCNAFLVYLREGSFEWFWSLKPVSVNSLVELVNQFIYQFFDSSPAVCSWARLVGR